LLNTISVARALAGCFGFLRRQAPKNHQQLREKLKTAAADSDTQAIILRAVTRSSALTGRLRQLFAQRESSN
jgi:hypothetical protein